MPDVGNHPIEMRYANLETSAQYRIHVVYAGDTVPRIRLMVSKQFKVHPFIKKEFPVRPVEFDIPAQATAKGNSA